MGNISSMARASTALDSYVSELGTDISYDKSLSSSRFMKTIVARHKNGPLVLKIFIKPDTNMTLRVIQRRLKTERDALAHLPNVNTYANFIESDKAGYLIRQWVGSSLYDRLSTQPYLTEIEKKWIAFQLLTCLRDARTNKVPHGDIKTDNVLITSDLTVLVTDFSSSFKPTYLPLDDPSDFAFFFDTSARRTCYIAPERFYEANSKIAQDKAAAAVAAASSEPGASSGADSWEKRDGKVTEEMDVFSAGCVLAETWTDGRNVFNLSELFAYRNGSLGLGGILDNLAGDDVKSMIASMLSREPSERPTFDRILATYRGTIFPEYFYTFLKDYATELAELPDSPDPEFLQKASTLPGSKIDRMLEQWESISVHLEGANDNGPALLLLNIVTSSIRNALSPSSRLHGLKLFLNLCPFLMDEDKVDRVVPFVVELLSDEVPIVRAEACRTLVIVVESVQSISQQNATFIPEYLLPQTGNLANDSDIFVRATYARALVRFADAAVRMLELCQAAQPVDGTAGVQPLGDADYDLLLAEIQTVVENQASILLVDSAPNVKRGMLSTVSDLCLFFGRQKSNDVVLSHIMTYLNDRDWQLRLAFFDGIVAVGAFIGIKAIDEYVLPLMMQALADPEEAVVARVIGSLSSLTSLGLLPRLRLWDVFAVVQGFLYHPNAWIRQGAAGFVAAAARHLSQTDVWCILYPSVRTALRADVLALDEESILSALVPPLSRATLQLAKSAALQSSPPGFWSAPPSRSTAKAALTKSATSKMGNEFPQLKDKGINPKDEKKIIALRDLIAKQAFASRAREGSEGPILPETKLTTGKSISLIELGVTPQTVFISPRTVGVVDARLDLKRLRPDLAGDTPSRRTSFASRSARGAPGDGANPLEEVRKRLASLEPPSRASVERGERPDVAHTGSPSESAISSTADPLPPPSGRHRLGSKAAPAVAAVTTTAVGTTTIHDEPGQVVGVPAGNSGRSTPVAATPVAVRGPLAPYASTYEGADPGVRAFLEQVDLENYREPLLDFGPRVVASHRKRGARAASSSPKQVTMIAHLPQHTGAVTAIVTSPDEVFFATASEDSSILIWDIARLERTVAARPRLTYRMDAPVRSMCRIDETHCLAAAAEDGSLSILRVHVAASGSSAKYKSIEVIRTWRTNEADGYVMHVSHLHESSLLIVTSTGMIGVLDMRTMELRTQLYQPQELGPVSAVYPSQHWLVVGTVTGALSLWDLRFGLLLKSWSASGGVTSLALHPSLGRGRWVMASIDRTGNASNDTTAIGGASSSDGSGGGPLVETYDIETGRLVESYEVRTTRPSSRTPAREQTDVLSTKSELIAELAGGRGGLPTITFDSNDITSVQSVLVGQGFASLTGPSAHRDSVDGGVSGGGASGSNSERSGAQGAGAQRPGWMVTAGDDRVIRYWDLSRPSDGFVICGSQREKDVGFKASPTAAGSSNPQLYYTLPNSKSTPGGLASSPDVPGPGVPRSAHAANQQRQPLRPHYDSVCALGVVETPFSSCIVSADRSGVIKVWRMEGGQARQ
ncbi:Phosphoinositide 3-kinase regulatory subunit 4 [Vanrija pseudolonga]|uniref:non-specific serine/threonine protein kinase n=1 Tax=Vanrija pseudolonga TaxID=143232 RepID=A0AAF0YJY6_9TREE|nr:Phosphoinositide 3-kinase regulatory subunit 4 [Vanrija pseudolonga]